MLGILAFVTSQGQSIVVQGRVLADDTMQPLPFAHIVIDSTGTTSNLYGEFKLKINPTDTLHFSYIGYKKKTYTLPDTLKSEPLTIEIILLKDITFLHGVTVTSLPETLDDLKEEVLATEVPIEQALKNAKKGIQIATYQYLYMKSFKLPMNAYDNYAMFLKGNEGLNPAGGNVKGLLKFLRNRAQGKPLEGTYQHYKYYQKTKGQ